MLFWVEFSCMFIYTLICDWFGVNFLWKFKGIGGIYICVIRLFMLNFKGVEKKLVLWFFDDYDF